MKFLCVACDEAMQLRSVEGPDEGSVTVTFGCPGCGHRIAMLTNPVETQLVQALGVKIGGRQVPPEPLEVVGAMVSQQREGALEVGREQGLAWSEAAEARLLRLPPLARNMARRAVSRYARERGVSVVTPELMDEYRARTGF
ncbi:MAG: PCP reductase family protein [Candidatus Methylomirabilales bacterium]